MARTKPENRGEGEGETRQLRRLQEFSTAGLLIDATGVSVSCFAYWVLKRENIAKAEEVAVPLDEVFKKYPHWKTSEAQEREVRREMLKLLAKSSAKNLPESVNRLIRILKGGVS